MSLERFETSLHAGLSASDRIFQNMRVFLFFCDVEYHSFVIRIHCGQIIEEKTVTLHKYKCFDHAVLLLLIKTLTGVQNCNHQARSWPAEVSATF